MDLSQTQRKELELALGIRERQRHLARSVELLRRSVNGRVGSVRGRIQRFERSTFEILIGAAIGIAMSFAVAIARHRSTRRFEGPYPYRRVTRTERIGPDALVGSGYGRRLRSPDDEGAFEH